jgi:hypothetical protein
VCKSIVLCIYLCMYVVCPDPRVIAVMVCNGAFPLCRSRVCHKSGPNHPPITHSYKASVHPRQLQLDQAWKAFQPVNLVRCARSPKFVVLSCASDVRLQMSNTGFIVLQGANLNRQAENGPHWKIKQIKLRNGQFNTAMYTWISTTDGLYGFATTAWRIDQATFPPPDLAPVHFCPWVQRQKKSCFPCMFSRRISALPVPISLKLQA